MNVSLAQVVKLLAKNILLIVLSAVIGLAGAFMISKFVVKPTYISTVKLYVSTNDTTQNSMNNLNDLNYAQKIVNTYIEMLQTNRFYSTVKDKSGTNLTLDEIKKMITFSILNDTEVFQASVASPNPSEAKSIADLITMLAPDTINSIKESATLKVVDVAEFPEKPSSPNIILNSIVGFLLGALLSVLFVFLREALDVRIKDEDDVLERYNIPILGCIPDFEFSQGKNTVRKTGSRRTNQK